MPTFWWQNEFSTVDANKSEYGGVHHVGHLGPEIKMTWQFLPGSTNVPNLLDR